MKIRIIGCSGSGKTYLANALSKKYNISHFDLDDIQWDNNAKEYGKKTVQIMSVWPRSLGTQLSSTIRTRPPALGCRYMRRSNSAAWPPSIWTSRLLTLAAEGILSLTARKGFRFPTRFMWTENTPLISLP